MIKKHRKIHLFPSYGNVYYTVDAECYLCGTTLPQDKKGSDRMTTLILRRGTALILSRIGQDPHYAIGQTSADSRWIAVALCVLTVISVILIIVAMIPRNKK